MAEIIVPERPYSYDSGCLIVELDEANNDATHLHTGPGSNHPILLTLSVGDVAYLRVCENGWCYVEGGSINEVEAEFQGWIELSACMSFP